MADGRPPPRQLVDSLGSAGATLTAGDHAAAAAAGSKAAAAQALLDALAGGAGRALECVSHVHLPAGAELGALVPSGAPPAAVGRVALPPVAASCPLPA